VAEQQELELDRGARPVAAPVEEALLDGELVLYNPVDHRIHHLDRTGALVWQLLDGTATVGELVDDIAEAFGAPAEQIEADVADILTSLAGEGLLEETSSGRMDPYPADHLSDPANPCDSDLPHLSMGDWITIAVNGRRVALRTTPALTDGLGTILDAHRSTFDPDEAEAHFSAFVSQDDRDVHRLYHGFCPRTRSVDPSRVLRSLVDHAAMALPAEPGTISLFARVAILDGQRAVVLPHMIDEGLQKWDARLRQAGVVLSDAPIVGLDIGAREIVLSDRLGYGAALDELAEGLPARRQEAPPAPGRYPIERWWFVHFFSQPGPATRAQAARRAAQILDPGRDLDAGFFEELGGFFEEIDAQIADMRKTDPIQMLLGSQG
jgi:hypothetical protein